MPLSPSTIKDIQAEIAYLRDLKLKIDARIHALEATLLPLERADAAAGEYSRLSAGVLPSVGALNAEPKTGPYSGLDLRPAILKVLKERGPMRAPDIAEVLAEGGFINASTTPLGTRVYNDLWRQSQKHQVKLDMGVFSLP